MIKPHYLTDLAKRARELGDLSLALNDTLSGNIPAWIDDPDKLPIQHEIAIANTKAAIENYCQHMRDTSYDLEIGR